MRIVHTRCAGIDVHKRDVTVCLITQKTAGQRVQEVRTFRTVTKDLLAMRDWLQDHGCEVVAVESTGVYWKPVFNLLEDDFEVLLVNPAHLKHVPGGRLTSRIPSGLLSYWSTGYCEAVSSPR